MKEDTNLAGRTEKNFLILWVCVSKCVFVRVWVHGCEKYTNSSKWWSKAKLPSLLYPIQPSLLPYRAPRDWKNLIMLNICVRRGDALSTEYMHEEKSEKNNVKKIHTQHLVNKTRSHRTSQAAAHHPHMLRHTEEAFHTGKLNGTSSIWQKMLKNKCFTQICQYILQMYSICVDI